MDDFLIFTLISSFNFMELYCTKSRKVAGINKKDFLTNVQLLLTSNDHPRGSINIRYEDGHIASYNLDTIASLILDNLPDPYTQKPFRSIDIDRAFIYIQSMHEFPDYKIENNNTIDLFDRWINSYTSQTNVESEDIKKVRLEARCFLQAEDLTAIFRKYCGNGNLENRTKAEQELSGCPIGSWLIRNSSIVETEYDKPLVITIKTATGYNHVPIVHKIGIGFYKIDGNSVERGQSISIAKILPDCEKPTIIDLLESIDDISIVNAYKGNDNQTNTNIQSTPYQDGLE